MARIHYKNFYMVLHSWTAEFLDMLRVADNIETLLVNGIEKRRLIVCSTFGVR